VARLYANENFPYQTTLALRGLGHDVLTTQEAGLSGQAVEDDAVLEFAASVGRAVVTLNRRDFIRLHNTRPRHRGIIVCTADPEPAGLAERIDAAIRGSVHLDGQLVRVNRPSSAV
jgi:hypothetical protein